MATFTVTVADDALAVAMRTRVAGTEAIWVQQLLDLAFAPHAEQAWLERQTAIADAYETATPAVRAQVDGLLRRP